MTKSVTKTYTYAEQLYAELLKHAQDEILNGKEFKVFRGRTTATFGMLGISLSYYSAVWSILNEQRCITQVQRGARGLPSVLILNHAPDHDEFVQKASEPGALTTPSDRATLVADVQAIKRQLGGLDIRKVLVEYEQRLAKLEREGKEKNGKTT